LKLSRLDLDGAGSPEALVARILKLEPGLVVPIPLEALSGQLDIVEIADLETQGFEAALLTDDVKSQGAILVAKGQSRARRRFSIAHELGHFLMPSPMPPASGQFLCSAQQLLSIATKDQNRSARMEVEANRFASLLLMPPPLVRARLRDARRPRLEQIVEMAEAFGVSRDAMGRAYAAHHDEPIAALIGRHGKVLRSYHSRTMPWLSVRSGKAIPRQSMAANPTLPIGAITEPADVDADHWFEDRAARQLSALTVQMLVQREGFTTHLLHAELRGTDEPDETDLAERWRPRF